MMHACIIAVMQQHIKHIRALQRRGWTQNQIAEAAGIDRSTLTRALRPGAVVKSSTMAGLLGVGGRPPTGRRT